MTSTPIEITLIAAMGTNRVIGNKGALPWQMPDDQARFQAMTLGKPILMGRKTFDETGSPLPDRPNLVLSRDPRPIPGAEVFSSLEAAVLRAFDLGPELMSIGGAALYTLSLPLATGLCLTTIELAPDGDTFFPAVELSGWSLIDEQRFPANQRDPYPCIMQTWRRPPPPGLRELASKHALLRVAQAP